MVPKKIHYCWLSGDPMPRSIRKCMDTWRRVMPGYELKLWDTSNFDVASVPFVEEACRMRKWAFAADYIRMYALYHEGGIYLDSDVKVLKPFDDLLDCSFFSSLEYHPTQIERDGAMLMIDADGRRVKDGYVSGIQIQAAVMGAEKGCPFVRDVLDWYLGHSFIKPDGTLMTGSYINYSCVASENDNCLVVPIQCVKTVPLPDGNPGSVLFVQGDRPDNAVDLETPVEGVPEGFWAVPVETGISDTYNVEIKSGVEEGAVVFTQVQTESSWM